jgi:hypothetical protein
MMCNRFWTCVATRSLGLSAVLLVAGCVQRQQPRPTANELPLAQQVQRVRAGLADAVVVETVNLSDQDVAPLTKLAGLRRLVLGQTRITDAALAGLAELPQLEQLRCASPHLTDEGMASIAHMSQLRFLHLAGAPITDAGLGPIRLLPKLESFYLDGSRATPQGLADLQTARPDLHIHVEGRHVDGGHGSGTRPHDHGRTR